MKLQKPTKTDNLTKLLLLVLVGVFLFTLFTLYRYKQIVEPTVQFSEWYKQHKQIEETKEITDSVEVQSPFLEIDTIYRSMQGPAASTEVLLETDFVRQLVSVYSPQLLWLKGYKVKLTDENNLPLDAEFMCHNNINLGSRNKLPWKVNTLGTDKRLFTLTQGQTAVILPENVGIPVLSNQKLRVDFQVLNHNQPAIQKRVRQTVTLYFTRKNSMHAAYQQSVFVTKQIAGPKGYFGQKPPNTMDTVLRKLKDPKGICCAPSSPKYRNQYNPYKDQFNREYTGHWIIDNGGEEVTTDVTPMLDINTDKTYYYIGAHVHPFCDSLVFRDLTTKEIIWKANIIQNPNKIGLLNIPHIEFPEGKKLFHTHQYTLTSYYNKNNKVELTAMAALYLYLNE